MKDSVTQGQNFNTSGTVLSNFFVLLDVSMEISQRQFQSCTEELASSLAKRVKRLVQPQVTNLPNAFEYCSAVGAVLRVQN